MVTSSDVARLAGVSQATVSRAMSSPAQLSPATRTRVLAAMESLGYVPHAAAQSMKTQRTNTIGVVIADLTNAFYAEVLDELTHELNSLGYRVVVWNVGGDSHGDALVAIRERAVDGVIFTTATESSLELHAAVERNSPIVLINRVVDGLDCDQVSSSNHAGGIAVADLLVAHGRTRAAIITGDDSSSTSRDRSLGFLTRMRELNHAVLPELQRSGAFSHDASLAITQQLLSSPTVPDAIFCVNDNMAFGALDALRSRGVQAQECWVVGYDDVEMASWPSFDLTTVRQPSRQMARMGAQMLVGRLTSPGRPPSVAMLPHQLLVRGSTPL